MAPRVYISAGEASGDMHGANLARSLRAACPSIDLVGMGGQAMGEAGVSLRLDIKNLAVTGILEVLVRFPRLVGAFRRAAHHLITERPDVAVLIDAPEFNMRLARRARDAGIPVVYYISPQVWAWRSHRVREIERNVKRMLCILPFEVDFYREHNVDVAFVGHPLLDQPMPVCGRSTLFDRLSLRRDRPLVALLPGSRNNELEHMGPVLAQAARILTKSVPGINLVVPLAGTVPRERAERIFGRDGPSPAQLVTGVTYDALAACDVAVAAAGTVTLEAALLGTPLIAIYKTSWLSYALARWLVRVSHVSLVNLVAGRAVIPELIQHQATPEKIAEEVLGLIDNPSRLIRMKADLAEVRAKLGAAGASDRAAKAVLDLVPRSVSG